MKPEVTVETVRAALEKRGVDVSAARFSSQPDDQRVLVQWDDPPAWLGVQLELRSLPVLATTEVGIDSDVYEACRGHDVDSAIAGLCALFEDMERNARAHADALAATVNLLSPKPKTEPTA